MRLRASQRCQWVHCRLRCQPKIVRAIFHGAIAERSTHKSTIKQEEFLLTDRKRAFKRVNQQGSTEDEGPLSIGLLRRSLKPRPRLFEARPWLLAICWVATWREASLVGVSTQDTFVPLRISPANTRTPLPLGEANKKSESFVASAGLRCCPIRKGRSYCQLLSRPT